MHVQEFPTASREYYEQAFADGRLRVEGNHKVSRFLAIMAPADLPWS